MISGHMPQKLNQVIEVVNYGPGDINALTVAGKNWTNFSNVYFFSGLRYKFAICLLYLLLVVNINFQ